MRAKDFLPEVFSPNKAAGIHWASAHNAIAVVSDTQDLSVRFISHGKGLWAIEFNINNDYEMTGGGNVSVIFATVIEAVKQFIKKERMDEGGDNAFFFTAEEKSRAKMYDTLAKRVAKQVGWHVVPYDEMIADPKYKTPLSYGDYLFAIEPGPAPEHRQAAQKPQHGEFLTIYHVVNMEDPTHPAIRIKAKNGDEAERWVMKNVPEYKDVDPFAVFARKVPPDNRPIIDKGTVPPPKPKPQEDPNSLGARLRAKIDATNEATFGNQEVEGNALVNLKEKYPNLSTLLYFVPGLGQAMLAADLASQVQMYNQAIAKIEQKYPAQTIQTVQQKVGDNGEPWEPL